MSFRTNLQYLRAQRNMPQEQLAMLLGVSRQASSKWASEKAYPEMDKLLMICDLFGCTLDDLVLGDVSRPAASASTAGSSNVDSSAETASPLAASSKTAGIIAPIAELAQDITGYDEHRRRFALLIAGGVAAIVAGVGIGNLFDSSNSILGATPLNDFLTAKYRLTHSFRVLSDDYKFYKNNIKLIKKNLLDVANNVVRHNYSVLADTLACLFYQTANGGDIDEI